jgi:hypothetical protein
MMSTRRFVSDEERFGALYRRGWPTGIGEKSALVLGRYIAVAMLRR